MRLQLALNVENLEESMEFYNKMFDTKPAKIRDGYANYAIENPPLKLVLFVGEGSNGTINHLGVETETAAEVVEAEARLTGDGLETTGVADTMCCYADKTETWLNGPDSTRWEWYVKTGDNEQFETVDRDDDGNTCCPTDDVEEEVEEELGACC